MNALNQQPFQNIWTVGKELMATHATSVSSVYFFYDTVEGTCIEDEYNLYSFTKLITVSSQAIPRPVLVGTFSFGCCFTPPSLAACFVLVCL